MKIKGVTQRGNSYRARVTIAGICESKDFNNKDYLNPIDLKEDILYWLQETRDRLKIHAKGTTSKYKEKAITKILTQEVIKEYLHYSPETGIITWLKVEANCINPGDIAGCLDGDDYIQIVLLGKTYKAHRLIFLYMEGELPSEELQIDHKNRIHWDNSWDNLRKATHGQNQQNAVKATSSTGIKGLSISPDGLRYRTSITVNNKTRLKEFPLDQKEIALEYLRNLRDEEHGEFANHG